MRCGSRLNWRGKPRVLVYVTYQGSILAPVFRATAICGGRKWGERSPGGSAEPPKSQALMTVSLRSCCVALASGSAKEEAPFRANELGRAQSRSVDGTASMC